MTMLYSRSLILGILLALVPGVISAGGIPLGTFAAGAPTCAQHPSYEVQMISGAGPFAPTNDPYIKNSLRPKLTYNLLNTEATMPHLVVSIDSRGSFVPGRVSATVNTGHRVYGPRIRLLSHRGSVYGWDFAAFPAGAEELIHVQMHLKRRCCYSAFIRTFGNLTPNGSPDPQSLVSEGASGGSGSSR
jgi:hypothetical protein